MRQRHQGRNSSSDDKDKSKSPPLVNQQHLGTPDTTITTTNSPSTSLSVSSLMESNEIELLETHDDKDATLCDFCLNHWGNKKGDTPEIFYKFINTGAISHFECLEFAINASRDTTSNSSVVNNQGGVIKLKVIRAVDLPSVQMIGRQNPFVKVCLVPWDEHTQRQTKTAIGGGKNPDWSTVQDDEIDLIHPYNSVNTPFPKLSLNILNESVLTSHQPIASVTLDLVPLFKYPDVGLPPRWFSLSHGRILLQMKFCPNTKREELCGADATEKKTAVVKKRQHTFRLSQTMFEKCVVCDKMIFITSGGYQCATCGISVHQTSCMLEAESKIECISGIENSDSDKNNISSSRTLNKVGQLKVHVHNVHLCTAESKCTPPLQHVTTGIYKRDTFVRLSVISSSSDNNTECNEVETKSILGNANPVFDSKFDFAITDRGSVLKVDVVDLTSNAVIASTSNDVGGDISLYQILQMEADRYIKTSASSSKSLEQSYYNLDLVSDEKKVVGYINLALQYQESKVAILFNNNNQTIIDREDREFSLDTLKENFDRVVALVSIFWQIEVWYNYVVQFKNLELSITTMVVYTYICLYGSNFPAYGVMSLVVLMIIGLYNRMGGGTYYKKCIIESENMVEQLKTNRDTPFRSVATLMVAPLEAEVELPSMNDNSDKKIFIKMTYEPCDDDADEKRVEYVKTSFVGDKSFKIGRTHCVGLSSNPTWRNGSNIVSELLQEDSSNNSYTRDCMFQNVAFSWKHDPSICDCSICKGSTEGTVAYDHYALRYPICQPARWIITNFRYALLPWSYTPGHIRFELMLGTDNSSVTLGSASIPLAEVVTGYESVVWLPVEKNIDLPSSPPVITKRWRSSSITNHQTDSPNKAVKALAASLSIKKLRVRLSLTVPKTEPTKLDQLYSLYVQDSFKNPKATGNTSIAMETYRKFVVENQKALRVVQNDVGRICKTFEGIVFLFNWTHPWKSLLIFTALLCTTYVLMIVPFRYIMWCYGMLEFYNGYFNQMVPKANRFQNLLWRMIDSVPSRPALHDKIYAKERRMYRDKAEAQSKIALDNLLMRKLNAQWIGNAQTTSSSNAVASKLTSCFLIYRLDNRLVWYKTQEDAEHGSVKPLGQLILNNKNNGDSEFTDSTRQCEFSIWGNTGSDGLRQKRTFVIDIVTGHRLVSLLKSR